MNYREARTFMEGRNIGIHIGLDRIEALLEELKHPENGLKYIHIAGTNGKGSILSYVSTTLTHAGYKVGRYLSPTLYCYEERFQINGEYISKELYTGLAAEIAAAVERMEARGIPCPSPFELETVLCFLYFQREHCDYVVLECGMGGEGDATNVIPAPEVAVLASISLEHQEYLGNTLEEIAWTKSGIVKPGCTCVTGRQEDEALFSIIRRCTENNVPFVHAHPEQAEVVSNTLEGQEFSYRGRSIAITLPGSVQLDNAITAWTVLQALRDRGAQLTDEQIYEGMKKTEWNGRFTCIGKEPYFFVDGAHNPAAAEKLAESMKMYFTGRDVYCILGIFKDKDYRKIIELTAPLAKHIFAIETPDNPRALPAEELAKAVAEVNPSVEVCTGLEDAVGKAYSAADKEDVILSFGSLSNIGELTELVRNRNRQGEKLDPDQIRQEIDETDREIRRLIEKRVGLYEKVGCSLNEIKYVQKDHLEFPGEKVVFQGAEGAYTYAAMKEFFEQEMEFINVETWKEAMEMVASGERDWGVFPIENSTAGSVSDVYDLLAEYPIYIVGEQVLPINHALMKLPGAKTEEIQTLYSHPQAFAQCKRYLDSHYPELKQVEMLNTALAAKKIAEDQDPTQAAIASSYAAELYGLEIFQNGGMTQKVNSTRFVIVSNKREFREDAKHVSICVELPHERGSLYSILSHFIINNLNMTGIKSRPIEDKPWEYRFFIDFDGNLNDIAVQNALLGIGAEANLRLLGNY